jgi:hypothetical protein
MEGRSDLRLANGSETATFREPRVTDVLSRVVARGVAQPG